jgi:type II secretory pathway component PulM
MSNFLNSFYTNLNDLVNINASDINTQKITANEVNADQVYSTNLNLTGSIINGVNSLSFNQQYEFIDVAKNFHIYGTGFIDYQGTTYNIGEILSAFVGTGTVSPYPSITYNSTSNTTTFTGAMVFPNSSIVSGSINNSDFATISTTQTLSNKEFSGTTIFSSIQLNSGLILNSGALTLPQSTLQNIQYLSGLTSNLNTRLTTDETDINNLKIKNTAISYNSTTQTTSFINNVSFPSNSISSTSINNITFCDLFTSQNINGIKTFLVNPVFNNNAILKTYVDGTAMDITTSQSCSGQKTFSGTQIFSSIQLNSDLVVNTGTTITNLQLQLIPNISTNTTNISTNTNDISTLNTKTQYISSTSLNTTITDTLNTTNLVFSKLNTLPASYFTGISSNIQDSINDAVSKANNAQASSNNAVDKASTAQNRADSAYNLASGAQATGSSAFALAGTAQATGAGALALAGTANTSANTANSVNTTQQTSIDQNITDITTLQAKTFSISRNATTNITTIAGTLTSATIRLTSLDSGLNQSTADAITFAGYTTINNTLYMGNYNSIIVDGILNQTSTNLENGNLSNQLKANTNILGTLTASGTSTTISSASVQIGVNSTNTFNCNSAASFGGDVSMLASKNLRLRNIVPLLGDHIYFGEGQINITDDVVFNMKMIANRQVNINNTFQVGTTLNRNTLTTYNTTSLLDANTSITLNSPIINITAPYVAIGQTLGFNYLYGTTFVQNLYSSSGIVGMAGQVFQQF